MAMTREFLPRFNRLVADSLIVLRVLLSLSMIWLGLRGKAALSAVALVTTLAWLTDLIDGPFARRSPDHKPKSWLGRHDSIADLSVALGVTAYLTLSGYMATWLGLGLILAAIALRSAHSYNLPWLVIPIPYATLLVLALRFEPFWGYLMAGYLLFLLLFGHRRIREQYYIEFRADMRSFLGRRESLDRFPGDQP
jgi:hypothetical protein